MEQKTTRTYLGTKPYMAPELLAGKEYIPSQVDIFAVGAISFILNSAYFGFNKASLEDPTYNLILQGKTDSFWRYHDAKKRDIPDFFSPDFKKMVSRMIHPISNQNDPNDPNYQYDPTDLSKRAIIKDIKNSDWYKNTPSATLEDA